MKVEMRLNLCYTCNDLYDKLYTSVNKYMIKWGINSKG